MAPAHRERVYLLQGDAVHIWIASLEQNAGVAASLATSLAPDERDRSSRLNFPADRARYVAARGILRDILSRYLGCPPAAVRLHDGAFGKPGLAGDFVRSGLQFNLSHTEALAVYALAYARPLGIDVEQVRPLPEAETIARRFLSPDEYASICSAAAEDRARSFFAAWTATEARLKARGVGLSGLREASVEAAVRGKRIGNPGLVGVVPAQPSLALQELRLPEGYVGFLACEMIAPRCTYREWAPSV